MAELRTNMVPANWQITATTIECDKINEYVTIMVLKDWSSSCTWCNKYRKAAGEDPKHKFSKEIRARIAKCQGADCKYVIDYRDKLIGEEKAS